MNDLREITREPYFLEKAGFVRREEETADVVRWVWYEKTIESQVTFVVQVKFEMSISDDPFVKTSDNFSYSFNGVFLKVIEEQSEEEETFVKTPPRPADRLNDARRTPGNRSPSTKSHHPGRVAFSV